MRPPLPRRLLFLSVLVISLSTQPVFLLAAGFFEIGSDLGFSTTGLGALTASFFLTAAAMSPIMGRLVQRIGWRSAMRINAVASSALLLAIAALARSIVVFGFLLLISATAYGLSNPSTNLCLAGHVDPQRRAFIFGIKHAGIPASTLLAGLALPTFILSVGWRWAYVAVATLGVVVLLLIPEASPDVPATDSVRDPRNSVSPLTTARLNSLAIASTIAILAAAALGTYLVAATVELGYSQPAAGLLLSGGSAASITSRLTAGHLTDRIGSPGFGGITILATAGAIAIALLSASSGGLFAALVLVAFATGWGWPGLMTYAVVNANPDTVAESSAITHAGVFLGFGAGPLVLGFVADRWSFDAVWIIVAVALAAAAAIVTLVGRSAVAAE